MKKVKATKIFLLIIAIALLVGSVIGIVASAEESDAYAIKKVSIAHGERTFILMAIDADIANADNIEVKYTIDGTEYVAKRYASNYVDSATSKAYPVYYTHGISPQDIGEDVIAEAHKVGATDYTPITFNVSIAEYLYNQLYAEGLISATTGADLSYKTLCEAHLAYGAAAQQALHNEKPENANNQKVLITERSYVYSAYATINGTTAKELILAGKTGTVTLAANASAPADRLGWSVATYDANGNVTVTEFTTDTVEITGHSVITPLMKKAIDFESAALGKVTGIENVNHKSNDADSGAYIVNDPLAEAGVTNNVLHMDANGDNVDWDGGNVLIDITPGSIQDGANCYVLEFDMLMTGAATTHDSTVQLSFLNADASRFCYIGLKNIKGASLSIQRCVSGSTFGTFASGKSVDQWVTVRIEYYSETDYAKIYFDGSYMGENVWLYGAADDTVFSALRFYTTGECAMDVYLDNIVVEAIVKPYVSGNPS